MASDSPPPSPKHRHVIGVGVVVLRNGPKGVEVLLIRRGKAPRRGEWSIPGGQQEPGETVRETAAREIEEETGLILENLTLVDVVDAFKKNETDGDDIHWTLIDFCAWVNNGAARAGSDAAEVRWVPMSELNDYDLWGETYRVIANAATKTGQEEKEFA